MTAEALLRRVAGLNTYKASAKRGGRRAPHKPLLLLFALGRVLRGGDRLIPFAEVERHVGGLMRSFGAPRSAVRPQYPFRWLLTDGLWDIPRFGDLLLTESGDLHVSQLRKLGVEGGLPQDVYALLRNDPRLALRAAWTVLRDHFPESVHRDIFEAAGIPEALDATEAGTAWESEAEDGFEDPKVRERESGEPTFYSSVTWRRRRDPLFRRRVLEAYEERCAVCDLDIRLGERLLGLEAAHIQWHSHEGPDHVTNGLALCLLHHKALDRGAMGLEERKGTGFKVLISRQVRGERTERLVDFRGRPIRSPRTPHMAPAPSFVAWHRSEVFRSPRTSDGTDGTR